jgi:protein-S-isoprenylcysteine O-methyltransferase Ste14
MNILIVATAAVGLVCFGAFSWGLKAHFRQTGAMPPGMQITSALSLAGFIWFLVHLTGGVTPAWPVTLALFAGSLAIFFWAVRTTRHTPPTVAFDTDQPSFLLHQGPYRFVRHPFYLAYLLFWTGTAAISPHLYAWAAPVVMGTLYFYAATREERKFAMSELSTAYAAYRAQTGMFLPRVGSLLACYTNG